MSKDGVPVLVCPVCEAELGFASLSLSLRANPAPCPQCRTVMWHKDGEVLCWKVFRPGTNLSA